MSNIVLLRLTTGEELVCNDKGNNRYSKVACLIPNGKGGIAIMPWMPYVEGTQTDGGVVINETVIVFKGVPVDDLVQEYNSNFGSGIITPPKKELIV
jgi:hypothetical protein